MYTISAHPIQVGNCYRISSETLSKWMDVFRFKIDQKMFSQRLPYPVWKRLRDASQNSDFHIWIYVGYKYIYIGDSYLYTNLTEGNVKDKFPIEHDFTQFFLRELFAKKEKGHVPLEEMLHESLLKEELPCPLKEQDLTTTQPNNIIINKENEKMKTNFNFDFGPVTGDSVRMSLYGLAIKNTSGIYVAYAKDKGIIDVDIFNFSGDKMFYKIPAAIAEVRVGDIVIHNKVPMFISDVLAGGTSFEVIDIREGEKKTIIPTVNMFGFNFVTKVVSIMDMNAVGASASQPFGNMLPLLMLSDSADGIDPMMLMMMGGAGQSGMDFSNPMMMYFLISQDKKGGSSDMLPLMMMMSMNAQKAPTSPVFTNPIESMRFPISDSNQPPVDITQPQI